MTKEELIEITNNIDIFEKFKMYMHYVIIQLGLKHNFYVLDLKKYEYNDKLKHLSPYHGWGSKPDKIFNDTSFFFLWEDIPIRTFEEFCDPDNIEITPPYLNPHNHSVFHYIYGNIKYD